MTIMFSAVLAFIISILSGCASPEVWRHSSKPPAEWHKEAGECSLEALKVKASASSYLVGDMYADQAFRVCMTARGYKASRS